MQFCYLSAVVFDSCLRVQILTEDTIATSLIHLRIDSLESFLGYFTSFEEKDIDLTRVQVSFCSKYKWLTQKFCTRVRTVCDEDVCGGALCLSCCTCLNLPLNSWNQCLKHGITTLQASRIYCYMCRVGHPQKASKFLCLGTKHQTDMDGTKQNERIN